MKSNLAISVRGLGKAYTLARNAEKHSTLAEAALHRLRHPLSSSRNETFWALRDVSFDLAKGEVVGIIGRNGAGKSTLLKILSRITKPTTGEIDLNGRIGSLLEVGTGFHPELTGRENIYLNGHILGMRKQEIDRQFDAIVDFAGVEKFLATPVKRYSSGMYVRLAFAVAAHLRADILVVDEVLAVGDAEFQKKCMGKMRDVATSGRTVLFVSHNMNAVASLCNVGILLHKGQLRAIGPAGEILDDYCSLLDAKDYVDLSEHPSRAPAYQPIIRSVSFSDESGSTALFEPGAKMKINLEIDARKTIRSPKLSVGVTSSRGERIFAIASYMGESGLSTLEGIVTVACTFMLPALVPGRYTLDIGIGDDAVQFLDAVYAAAAFDIRESNYLGMTHGYFPEMGYVMVRSKWDLAGASADSGPAIPVAAESRP